MDKASSKIKIRDFRTWLSWITKWFPKYISNFGYYSQCLLKAWLTEKEESLNKVQTSNFKDQKELSVSVRRLAVSDVAASTSLVSLWYLSVLCQWLIECSEWIHFPNTRMLPCNDLEPECFSFRELKQVNFTLKYRGLHFLTGEQEDKFLFKVIQWSNKYLKY